MFSSKYEKFMFRESIYVRRNRNSVLWVVVHFPSECSNAASLMTLAMAAWDCHSIYIACGCLWIMLESLDGLGWHAIYMYICVFAIKWPLLLLSPPATLPLLPFLCHHPCCEHRNGFEHPYTPRMRLDLCSLASFDFLKITIFYIYFFYESSTLYIFWNEISL